MSFMSPVSSSGSRSSTSSPRSSVERRECLRGVLDRTKTISNIGLDSVKNLEEIVKEADTISSETPIDEKVSNHDEVLMDSEVMATSSKLLKTTANTLSETLNVYNMTEFAERLLLDLYTTPEETLLEANWSKLEIELPKCFKRTAHFTMMSGSLETPEPKVVVKRQLVKRERDALAPIKRPDAIVDVEKTDESVEETVSKIKKLISNHHKTTGTPLQFFRLILHPTDFGKTIENMLHVSFLVRDGIVQMLLDKDGHPVILPTTKEMRSSFKHAKDKSNTQCIVSLSFQQWQMLVTDLQIREPMINFQ